jgi:glycolate oxidase iron-sulfur subunit
MEEAKAFAQKNIEAFEQLEEENGELDAIVINAAGCGASLKEYGGWFKDDAQWEERARKFADKVKDVSEFLAEEPFRARLQERMNNASTRKTKTGVFAGGDSQEIHDAPREVTPNTAGASTLQALGQNIEDADDNRQKAQESQSSTANSLLNSQRSSCKNKVTYHDACHLAHGQGIRTQPRELLGEVSDLDMIPLTESEMCCGSAGVYNITQPAMAMQLLERKMKHIEKTGAKIVVTGNPGCMMQLMLGAKKYDVDVEVKHPIEILDKATR